jgi:hypothetical protein
MAPGLTTVHAGANGVLMGIEHVEQHSLAMCMLTECRADSVLHSHLGPYCIHPCILVAAGDLSILQGFSGNNPNISPRLNELQAPVARV